MAKFKIAGGVIAVQSARSILTLLTPYLPGERKAGKKPTRRGVHVRSGNRRYFDATA